ncbi:WD repeat-containing protein 93 isoform X1 [Anas platyrhynchos]|uniref:WD repeat-containing protein 93 isoform X1 n=2 Tax=Anas platyrhynchos TaxID=8839 RepID=UPI003AF311D8
MPARVRKHSLEIPPPSEEDWLKDDEEDFFQQDPERIRDVLPQPFRMANKLVMLVFENAMEIIERRETLREAQKLKGQPTKCFPTAEFQVTGTANCLSVSGKFIFVGLSVGLAAFRMYDCKQVCVWDAVKTEICVIRSSDLGNEHHVLLTVDEMGLVSLFCFHRESFLLIKILNEVEDISKRSTCVEVVLSSGGDYAGVLLQGNSEVWLEVYRLPKDSWLKETEKSSGAAAGLAFREKRSSWTSVESFVSANKAEAKLSLPVLVLKVKPPKPITGTNFKSPLDALKKVDDGSMLGLGHNHLIKDSQWEQHEAIFRSIYREFLEAEGESESKDEVPRRATFHFLLPSWILQGGTDIKVQPDVPASISVYWDGSHNLCFYLLNRPLKERVDADLKPDVVWPCAAPIACSAVSSWYLALACEDSAITIWDKHLGYPLSVTVMPEKRPIRSIHFLQSAAAASSETPCPGTDPPSPAVELLVLCTDGSLYLLRASRAKKPSITLLADRPEDPNLAVTAVVPVLAFPSAALVFSWDGTVSLMNTATSQMVCCFNSPPSHAVASPWQPVFTLDTVNWCLLLRGDEQQTDALAQSRASHSTIFLFYFNSYPLEEAFPKKPDLPFKSLQNLSLFERCNMFLRDSQQCLVGLEEQLPEYWSRLQARAAGMDKESQKIKGQKKP